MKKKRTALPSLLLALALVLSLPACSGKNTPEAGGLAENGGLENAETSEPAQTGGEETQTGGEDVQADGEEAQADDGQQTADLESTDGLSNGGLVLPVPTEYRDLLILDAPQNDENGVLFSVSEKASVEAEDYEGVGWICSIARISRDKLNELLCYDMSGMDVMAKDAEENYYVYCHPTDVRFARESYDNVEEDMKQWTMLNEWAATLTEAFPAANGLTAETRDHSDLTMFLARIACLPDTQYTISTTECGPLEPGDVDPSPYLDKLTEGVLYEGVDGAEAPDGEYVVLNFPEDGIRFDFFRMEGKENYVREVWGENGENELLLQASFSDGETKASAVMQTWYDDLAAAQGLGG